MEPQGNNKAEGENYNCEYCDNQIKQENQAIDELTNNLEDQMKLAGGRVFKKSLVNPLKERISIAPMVDVTDNYFRFFMRYLTSHSFLYTEMLNEHAILHVHKTGNNRLLDFTANQHPVVCQIGGNDPHKAAQAAKIVEAWGYDEVNLNCGCPSQRTVNGCFGA